MGSKDYLGWWGYQKEGNVQGKWHRPSPRNHSPCLCYPSPNSVSCEPQKKSQKGFKMTFFLVWFADLSCILCPGHVKFSRNKGSGKSSTVPRLRPNHFPKCIPGKILNHSLHKLGLRPSKGPCCVLELEAWITPNHTIHGFINKQNYACNKKNKRGAEQ